MQRITYKEALDFIKEFVKKYNGIQTLNHNTITVDSFDSNGYIEGEIISVTTKFNSKFRFKIYYLNTYPFTINFFNRSKHENEYIKGIRMAVLSSVNNWREVAEDFYAGSKQVLDTIKEYFYDMANTLQFLHNDAVKAKEKEEKAKRKEMYLKLKQEFEPQEDESWGLTGLPKRGIKQ